MRNFITDQELVSAIKGAKTVAEVTSQVYGYTNVGSNTRVRIARLAKKAKNRKIVNALA